MKKREASEETFETLAQLIQRQIPERTGGWESLEESYSVRL